MGSWGNSSEEILQQQFPLHRACRDGDVQIVAALLGEQNELGPSNGLFQEDTFYGWTPTHWAAYFGKLPCLVRLIEHGEVSCNISTFRFHQSPLHIAAFGGHGHCLQWLLQRGAQINRQDYLGETALHKAARTGSMECVSLLVSQGSKLSTQNYNSQTAAQLAVTCGFPECAKYLEKAHELQQPPRGIFQDLLPPGPLAPALNGTQSHHAPQQQKIAVISQGLNGGIIPPSHLNGTSDGVSHAMEEDAMDTGDTMMTEEAVGGMPYFAKAGGRGDGAPNGDVLLDSGVVHNHVPVAGRKRGREEVDIECLKRIRRGGGAEEQTPSLFSVDGVEAVTILPPKFVNPNLGQISSIPVAAVPPPVFPSNGLLGREQPNLTTNGFSNGQINGCKTSNGNQLLSNGFHGNQIHVNGNNSNQWMSVPTAPYTNSALEHHSTVNMQQGYDSLMVESLITNTHGQ